MACSSIYGRGHILLLLWACFALLSPARADEPVADAPSRPDLTRADALLAAGEFDQAAAAYQAAIAADPRNLAAVHGAAMAQLGLKQDARAKPLLERAYALAPGDRSVVHNLAMLHFRGGNQPRALKLLTDYLAAHPKPYDEPLLDGLLFMIQTADEAARKTRVYDDARAGAITYAARLEAERPGYRRWGNKWEEAPVVEQRLAANREVQKDLDKLDARIADQQQMLDRMDKQTRVLEERVRRRFEHRSTLHDHIDAVSNLRGQRDQLLEQRAAVAAKLYQPPVPPEPAMIAFGVTAPPLQGTELAQAGQPTSPAGTATTPDPTPPTPTTSTPTEPTAPTPPATTDPTPVAPPVAPPVTAQVPANPAAPSGKRVTTYGVAFAIGQDTLITSRDLVEGASDIVVQAPNGQSDSASVFRTDAGSGLAILRIKKLKAASLLLAANFEGGAIECVGMPTVDLFKADAVTIAGSAPRPSEPWTVKLTRNPRLPGAPLLAAGKVVGVTLAARETEADAVPAVTLQRLSAFIGQDSGTRGAPSNQPRDAVFQLVVTHTTH